MAHERVQSKTTNPHPQPYRNAAHVGIWLGGLALCFFIGLVLPFDIFDIIISMRTQFPAILAGVSSIGGNVFGQKCQLETIRSSPPTDGQSTVAIQSYSYCWGRLNVTVCCHPVPKIFLRLFGLLIPV